MMADVQEAVRRINNAIEKDLQFLSLAGLKLSDDELPDSLWQITGLASLDLSHTKLTTLPESISELKQLTDLNLDYNHLTALPESIGELKQLTQLNLTNNQLTALPESIGELKHLTELYLTNNQLTALPESIGELKQLTWLDLSHNQLTALPESIGELKQLTQLNLNDNQLTALPESIGELKQLTGLDFGGNQLTALPESIGELKQLRELNLNYNQLTALPECIGKLKQLGVLNLRDNQLKVLPTSIGQLTELTILDLGGNRLTELPESFTALTHLNSLILSKNALTKPPQVQADRGFGSICDYFEQINTQGEVINQKLKLNIVGNPCAGKTTLFNRLAKHVDPNFSAELTGEDDRTIGLNIFRPYKFEYNNRTYTVNIWDYGGQRIQYMSHHYLMTSKSLFVLLIDSENSENIEDNTDYWIQIIRQLAKESRICVIYNQKNNSCRLPTTLDIKSYQKAGVNITEAQFDIIDDRVFSNLLDYIHASIDKFPFEKILRLWLVIEDALQSHPRPYITLKEFREFCVGYRLDNERYQDGLIVHLRNTGSILHYANSDLKDLVFLKPEWVTGALYHVFTDSEIERDQGVFNKDRLSDIWYEHRYTKEQVEHLRKLMLNNNFEICYLLDKERSTYLMPMWLSTEPPANPLPATYQRRYRYRYSFLPFGFISHLIIRFRASDTVSLSNNTEKEISHWRTGLRLEHQGSTAEIIQLNDNYTDITIEVTYRGESTHIMTLLKAVAAEFDRLCEQFSIKLARTPNDTSPNCVSISIECPHCIEKAQEEPRYHHYLDLVKKVKDGKAVSYYLNVNCYTCKSDFSPKALVTGDSIIRRPHQVPTTKKQSVKLARRLCYRQYIEILASEKYPKDRTNVKIADAAKKGYAKGVDPGQVGKMLNWPLKLDDSLPGEGTYEKVLLGLGGSLETFADRYSGKIEALVNNSTIFQALLNADFETDKDRFNSLLNSIDK